MCLIQETNVIQMSVGIIASLWGPSDCEWSTKGYAGTSGGSVTIRKKGSIVPILSFKGKRFLGINVLWKGINYYFLNVYSPNILLEE